MVLLNKTAHAIIFGSTVIVPAKPLKVDFAKADLEKVGLSKYIDSGDVEIITQAEAKKIEKKFEEQSAAELRAYAKEHDIKIPFGSSKAEIIAAIKEHKGL